MEGESARQGVFTIKQDARLLNREVMIRTLVGKSLPSVAAKHGLRPGDVDWFLPHYSSHYFRESLLQQLQEIDFSIPEDRWFTSHSDGEINFFGHDPSAMISCL